jgi:serine/threonine-protein kinase
MPLEGLLLPTRKVLVPAWVHAALIPGLAFRPQDRYPSLLALIAALTKNPGARRRRLGLGVAIGAAFFAALAALVWVRPSALEDPCAHSGQDLAGAWDEAVKGRVQAAFLGTGRPYAEDTFVRVVARLDRYASDWNKMRLDVCRTSQGDAQHREIATLRDACLDRRRDRLRALAALFADKPDPQVLDKAVTAAADLYPLDYCADTAALTARVHPPEDPTQRARVAALEPRAERVEALFSAGKYIEGVAIGEALLPEAAATGYAPLRAEVEYWLGRCRDVTGDIEGGKALLQEAAVSASEGRDELLAVLAWTRLLQLVVDHQRRFEEAAVIRALGRTAVVRVQDGRTRAWWMSAEGTFLWRTGKYAEAKATHERALALREEVLGPEHPETILSLALAGIATSYGDLREARPILERAVELTEKVQGPEHPNTAVMLANLGSVLSDLGELAEAAVVDERALAIRQKALGVDNPEIAVYYSDLGRVYVRDGRVDTGLPLLERSLALEEKAYGPSDPRLCGPLLGLGEAYLARHEPKKAIPWLERALDLHNVEMNADIQVTLAEALWQLGKGMDRARARVLAQEAHEDCQRDGNRPGLERAMRWLSDHPSEAPFRRGE